MSRLKIMPPRLQSLPPALALMPVDAASKERARNDFNPLRALYRTTRWKALRMATFMRDTFT